jgi:cation:H+ antiporter
MTLLVAVAAFVAGVVVVIVATQRLLEGLVGIANAVRVAPFVASVVLSGMEAENVAVGLAAGARGAADVALGTAFGGAIFLLCTALGLGAVIAPLRVRLPRGVVLLMPAAALAAGLPVVFGATPRWTGVILLAAFGLAIAYLVAASRHHRFVESAEVREASEKQRSIAAVVLLTIVGIALIAAGGALVAYGADGIIHTAGLSAGIVGMVITPAAIEAEEIIRQVVPAQRGYADVSAGNVVGTVLYFLLFNLGLISLFTPVAVSSRVRFFDWPFLVASAVAASLFLVRGRVNRLEGAALAGLGVVYVALHVLIA